MAETRHTPGPWSVLETQDGETPTVGPLTICDAANLDDLANVYSREDAAVSVPFDQALANARIMAAAPALYEVLKEAAKALARTCLVLEDIGYVNSAGPGRECETKIRAALASATGEA